MREGASSPLKDRDVVSYRITRKLFNGAYEELDETLFKIYM